MCLHASDSEVWSFVRCVDLGGKEGWKVVMKKRNQNASVVMAWRWSARLLAPNFMGFELADHGNLSLRRVGGVNSELAELPVFA